MNYDNILLTGGKGTLGKELQTLLPGIHAPDRATLELTRAADIDRALEQLKPSLVVHAAAYTDVAGAETARELCWQNNVVATRLLVRALQARAIALVHISTDYVFYGDKGMYREDDTPGPGRNTYALTKLIAEELVRVLDKHLIIRTSFRPRVWPHQVAFDDLYTSQDYVDVIAPDIACAIRHAARIPHDTLHIATERKTVYELAKRRKPEVGRGSRLESAVALPEDISLDTQRWRQLRQGLR